MLERYGVVTRETVLAEVLRQSHHVRDKIAELQIIVRHSATVWAKAYHQAGTRWPADWNVAVCLRERNAAARKPSHVRCSSLRVSAKSLNVIVQVIADDDDDVGVLRIDSLLRNLEQLNILGGV